MTRGVLIVAFVLLAGCRDPAVLRAWLADWETARACMLASPEFGPDSQTAYAVSSFLKKNDCGKERIQLIAVPDADRSSIPEWDELREELETLVRGGVVARGIDQIDARVARLRRAARLPPIERVRDHAPTALGAAVKYEPPLQPKLEDNTLAWPSRSWSASADGDVLVIKEHDRAPVEIKLPGDYRTSRAMDRGNTRVVTLQRTTNGHGFAVAHSSDGGQSWKVELSADALPLVRSSQDAETGAIDVVVESVGHFYVHRFDDVEPWTFPERVELPRIETWSECRASGVLYVLDSTLGIARQLFRIEPAVSVQALQGSFHEIEACDRRSTLMISRAAFDQELTMCRDGKCTPVHRAPHYFESAAALREDGAWAFAAVNETIVGLWREGVDEPTFYRLQKAGKLVKLRVANRALELVLMIEGTQQVVSLPPL